MNDKKTDIAAIFIFLGFIFVIAVIGVFSPQRGFSPSENRYLQQKPEFTFLSLWDGSFGKDYEAYLSDQFPGRDGWIGLKVLSERLQLKQDINEVYFGKDDYLMEKFDQEDLVGPQLDQNIKHLSEFLLSAEKWLGEEHVRVMLVPSASQVLTEKLPWLAAPFDQGQITERLRMATGNPLVISVEEYLKEHQEEQIYYRTDHHWTSSGAYYGYQAWADSVGLVPWVRENFQIETVSRSFWGTIYSKVNADVKPDTIELYMPTTQQTYQVYYDGSESSSDSLYSYSALEGKDQYAVYLDGNHGLTEIVNMNVSEERKGTSLLIVKDSFAHSFAPFTVNHFERVYMIDLRYFNQEVVQFAEDQQVTDLLVLYQIPGFAKEKTVSKLK